ncbi:hypothetical protein MZM54_00685 [[Brevibacterium] frigoritolerans]|nr:hypothetical protein [Peribacillus frigoritolerans]
MFKKLFNFFQSATKEEKTTNYLQNLDVHCYCGSTYNGAASKCTDCGRRNALVPLIEDDRTDSKKINADSSSFKRAPFILENYIRQNRVYST